MSGSNADAKAKANANASVYGFYCQLLANLGVVKQLNVSDLIAIGSCALWANRFDEGEQVRSLRGVDAGHVCDGARWNGCRAG